MKKFIHMAFGIMMFNVTLCSHVMAQLPLPIDMKTPYYIDVNTVDKKNVYEIQEGSLSFQYHDKFGQSGQIPLTIYNWKLEVVGNFELDKNFGLNNYTIDLGSKIGSLETNKVYYCALVDESGEKHEWNFKNISPVRSKDLTIDIIVNPKRMSCNNISPNLVEFYGRIEKGKAPYTVRWYVMNQGKSDFLFQPKEDKLNKRGRTSVVQVDKVPSYYVVMEVTDACGTSAKQMVFLDCQKQKKRINTMFIQPLKTLDSRKSKPVENP